jgi:arylsulfatase
VTIRRFITLVFSLALLIVAVVHMSHRRGFSIDETLPGTDFSRPNHFFVENNRTLATIECLVTEAPNRAIIWGREISPCSLVQGWTPPNPWGSWAFGPESRVLVETGPATRRTLVLQIRANPDLPPEQHQILRLSVNGAELGEREVERKWHTLRFDIPASVLRDGTNEIVFAFSAGISPFEVGKNKDYRKLAAGVSELTLRAPELTDVEAKQHPSAVDVWDASRQTFVIRQSGVLVQPVLIPPDARTLNVGLKASKSIKREALRVTLAVEDLDGRSRRSKQVSTKVIIKGGSEEIQVEDMAGRWALMTIEVGLSQGRLEVRPARFDLQKAADVPTSAQPAPREPLPDIVLITLDAARADRFSYSGHDRQTSPFIDRLARESLVFTHAFALVPYTLCSVPTMITGLSFLDHGVVAHEDVLSQDAVTLAESLREMGYQTVAFSATPNNSIAKGFDQGYEIFREMWTEGPRKRTRRAHFIARKVVDWLDARTNDDRPLHLQVHMVPPHAPYDPPPAMDIFTDPEYDGPCTGFHKTIASLDGGGMEATPECLDHLLALYDGNIRTADAATELILNALRRRPSWRNTVVLVTSDHGEAFMDHGRMDHNSTVFSEMLHVPFVLRMPPGFDVSGIATEQLVTLADITPTLIGATGLPAPAVSEGINLLARNPSTGGRHLVSRTAAQPPVFGLRTLCWSMMIDSRGLGALYDIEVDPAERNNLHLDQAARFAGLGGILENRLDQPPQIRSSTESADISEEERLLLETLGYIR